MTYLRGAACMTLGIAVAACTGSASARLELVNHTTAAAARGADRLAGSTSLRLKMVAVYVVEDIDLATQDNVGRSAMIWLNPECADDISGCNVAGMTLPPGPRITQYFDLARPSVEVNAELNSQGLTISPGSYKYARVELCKAYGGQTQATVPTLTWRGPGMTEDRPFTSGDCGRTSLAFDPPLELGANDAVQVTLGYDLATSIVSGAPGASFQLAGIDHWFRDCADVDASHRVCMDFPDFAPSAARL